MGKQQKSLRSKAVHFVSDLTTVILNPISDKPSKHPTPLPHPPPEDVIESKRSQLEFVTEEDTGHLVEEPDTSSFTAFLYSLLSSSESGNNPKLDEQNDHSAQMGDQLSENVAKESGTKKGLFSKGKQTLRAVYQATRIGGYRSQESKGNSDLKNVDENDDFGLEVKSMPKQNMREPVALGDLPDISEPSLLLSEKERSILYVSLPALVQGRKWLLLYSTWRHGISLSTLYRRSMLWSGHSLLVVGDRKGAVFGGLVEAPLRPTNKKYQGTNSTFVFTNKPGHPVIFRPTGANRYFTLCSTDFLAIGGGGRFALYMDSDLLNGSSSVSETYGNPCLAHTEDFEVKEVEHRKRQHKKKSKKKESAPKVSPKMATTKRKDGTTRSERTNPRVWLYSVLLTLQYGAQPLISKRFTRREVIVTTSVLTCELAKVVCALILMARDGSLKKVFSQWTLVGSLTASGLPAAIYALQNSLLQISYKNLDSLTFSILNQTKIFFTAFFTYIMLRQKQSIQQIGALLLLIMAAVLLSIGEGSSKGSSSSDPEQILFYGIIPVLVASALSGLASALCQWASQVKKHSSYLMTVEMSIVGSLCLLASTTKSPDGEAIRQHGYFYGWTPLTMIPVVANALGGILVGLVTSYAGGVRKGFVIVSALLVTALLQFMFEGKPPSVYCLGALPLVMSSISIYQKYPYRVKKKES